MQLNTVLFVIKVCHLDCLTFVQYKIRHQYIAG